MALQILPPPPKFGTEGPRSDADWSQLYRWFVSAYQFLLGVIGIANQAVTFPNIAPPSTAIRGQLQDLTGLALSVYFRPSISPGNRRMSYVADATPNPMIIPASVHGQGLAFIVQCFTGPVSGGGPTGSIVYPQIDLDLAGTGDVTITFADGLVGSVIIQG